MQAPRFRGKGGKKMTNWLKDGETVQERRKRLAIIEVIKKRRGMEALSKAVMVL